MALPTCGLALAEAERYLPDLITRLEELLAEVGLGGQEITIRMTGCPNGCARPYMAEIGFVGKAPGRYQIWLGGNEACTRLNRLYRDMVKDPDIVTELRPLFTRYAQERLAGRAVRRLGRARAVARSSQPPPIDPMTPDQLAQLERRAARTSRRSKSRAGRSRRRADARSSRPTSGPMRP